MARTFIRPGILASLFTVLALGPARADAAQEAGKIPLTTSSDAAREEYQQGYTLSQNFLGKEASEHYEKAVALDPDFALAHLGLATTSPTAKEFFEHLGKAVALADKASEGERLWILAQQAGSNGDLQKQQELLEKLTALHPQDERAHVLLALFYFGRTDYDKAIESFEAAKKVAPDFPSPYNMLGYSYRALEKYPEAEKAFKRYTELLPDNPNPFDSYAELLLKLGRYDESIAQYRKALAVDPHFIASDLGIASDLTYQGKHEEARQQLEKAYATARDDGERRTLLAAEATVDLDEGKLDEALKQYQKMYDLAEAFHDPSNMAGDLGLMGTALVEMGKPDEAQKKFDEALKLVEGSSLSDEVKQNAKQAHRFNSALVALAKGDLPAAKAQAKEHAEHAAANGNVFQVRFNHHLQGRIALAEKDYDRAIAELKQDSQQNPYTLFLLAQASEGKGDGATAKATYDKVAGFNVLSVPNYAFVRSKARQSAAVGS